MNRREFLATLGGASALSIMNIPSAFAAVDGSAGTTSLYVKGLVMFDFGDPDTLRLGFPNAPGHKATISVVPQSGTKRTLAIKGHCVLDATGVASTNPRINIPELVRMTEFYGKSVKSHVDQCPSVINIPSAAIQAMSTTEVSPVRYTFVRADNGQEVETFRPRQIAETIKIDLSSAGTLKLNDGKINIPLETARELRVQYSPERADSIDPFADHFNHYFDYVERPAAMDFNVVPKKLNGNSAPAPRVGNQFIDGLVFCYLAAVQ